MMSVIYRNMDFNRYQNMAKTETSESKKTNSYLHQSQIKQYSPSNSPKFYDYIIIGSGAGGSPLAHYLTKAGAKVLMLEAGKRFNKRTFPDNEMDANAQLMWGGGTDLTKDAHTVLLRGKCVGGGTIVNQCLLDRFDDVAWNDFKTDSGINMFNTEAMASAYDEVESHLAMHTFRRDEWNGNAEIYQQAFDKLGYETKPLRRGQNGNCDGYDCVKAVGGCSRDSKQSMLITFLPKAEKQGLTLIPEFSVESINHSKHMVTVSGFHQGKQVSFYAAKCIVSAGAIGTPKLLMQSGIDAKLPAMGTHFHCHPQFMITGMFEQIVDAHKGAFQTLKSSDPRFRGWGFKLENVFAGPCSIAMLNYSCGKPHQDFMRKYRHMGCMEVAIRDHTPGTIKLTKDRRVVVDKGVDEVDKKRMDQGRNLVKELLVAAGGRDIMSSPLRIGLHLMGGARMGNDENTSVVNEAFKVHGYENLYVVDGSLFPNAPGINPSLSIMSLSYRASQAILKEAGQSLNSSVQPQSSQTASQNTEVVA